MSKKDHFKNFNQNNNPYETETIEIFGQKAVIESKMNMQQFESDTLQQLWHQQFERRAAIRYEAIDSEIVQQEMEHYFYFLNRHFGTYTKDVFGGLGMLYTTDERYKESMEPYGEGITLFLRLAMLYYSK